MCSDHILGPCTYVLGPCTNVLGPCTRTMYKAIYRDHVLVQCTRTMYKCHALGWACKIKECNQEFKHCVVQCALFCNVDTLLAGCSWHRTFCTLLCSMHCTLCGECITGHYMQCAFRRSLQCDSCRVCIAGSLGSALHSVLCSTVQCT
jgi:hypothetical protein